MGFVGRGEGVAALAVVTLDRPRPSGMTSRSAGP
jgi:hypothetical protein